MAIWPYLHPSISTALMRPRRPKQYCLQLVKPLKSEAIHETGLSGNVVPSFFPLIIFIYIYVYISKKNKCMLSTNQFLRLLKIQHATLLFVSFCSFSI